MKTDIDRKLRDFVGAKTAKTFSDVLGIETVGELLRHYPRRYLRKGELTPFDELEVGDQATVSGRVKKVTVRSLDSKQEIRPDEVNKYRRHKTITKVVVTDGRNDLELAFFNQPWLANKLTAGTAALFWGEVTMFRDIMQLKGPGTEILDEEDLSEEEIERRAKPFRPLYPASAKLPTATIERSIKIVLDNLGELDDPIPELILRKERLIGLREALQKVHLPETEKDWEVAQKRFRFEEALVMQTILAQRRAVTDALKAVPRVQSEGGLLDDFDARLPFRLTDGQAEVCEEIFADLARPHPMHRLLQGEVGSGKTVVALRAMLSVVDAGGQAVLLAPTEVLATQHHKTLTTMLGELAEQGMLGGAERATRVGLLTGSLNAASRRTAMLDAASGSAGIVVGTHALLEDKVQFADLGLVVVDEQHRFGVEQRAALSQKSGDATPHVLVMTATPIPRTVAMTVFGDLAVSTLTELPAGRSPIKSSVVPAKEKPAWLARAWERVREEVEKGHQAYVVCPRIGDEVKNAADEEGEFAAGSEEEAESKGKPRPAISVLQVAEILDGILGDLRVEILHGRLPADEKDSVMTRFAAGEIDVLIATTVIEVGVDVPNASTMVVMDADRFGISQLHQLRGRVGRGKVPGLCLLVTHGWAGSKSYARLEAVAATTDGFELSRIDLETRREGDVLGVAQSGRRTSLKLLSVLRDEEIILTARHVANSLISVDAELAEYPVLRSFVRSALESEATDYLEKT
ncbi:ATP-dependent DNA helicase RecG [Kribbella orskensis]|uniref:Probable DNA 3'-5' helicase RecG n=1 Tax=Kribbella orskensis TaxID=2512216 RepID=A0ABY2BHX3_9ACTN|nr:MULTISPECIES: ATP-dependent DNA helicase RecG [Kribbella]TCN37545.1 ATP-dependent DNA helicase RecG [Kribbella sp. VKM Ac-2500]TCO18953.1 ATP-dependent DNA helicase RecG [Kribbella orskensis]